MKAPKGSARSHVAPAGNLSIGEGHGSSAWRRELDAAFNCVSLRPLRGLFRLPPISIELDDSLCGVIHDRRVGRENGRLALDQGLICIDDQGLGLLLALKIGQRSQAADSTQLRNSFRCTPPTSSLCSDVAGWPPLGRDRSLTHGAFYPTVIVTGAVAALTPQGLTACTTTTYVPGATVPAMPSDAVGNCPVKDPVTLTT